MKALSTMVAAILLIAFTVAVGGLISVWLTSYSRTTTSAVESTTTNQTKCAGAYIKIDMVKTVSGYNGTSGTNTTVIYSNPSTQTISSIIFNSTGGEAFYGVTTSLSAGAIGTSYLNLTTGTKIIVKGLCLVTVSVEGSCESGQTCWKV